MAKYEKNYEAALKFASEFNFQYPKNLLAQIAVAKNQMLLKDTIALQMSLKSLRQSKNNFLLLNADFFDLCINSSLKNQKSITAYENILLRASKNKKIASDIIALSYYKIAQAYEQMGHQKQCKIHYKKSLEATYWQEVNDAYQAFLLK